MEYFPEESSLPVDNFAQYTWSDVIELEDIRIGNP